MLQLKACVCVCGMYGGHVFLFCLYASENLSDGRVRTDGGGDTVDDWRELLDSIVNKMHKFIVFLLHV